MQSKGVRLTALASCMLALPLVRLAAVQVGDAFSVMAHSPARQGTHQSMRGSAHSGLQPGETAKPGNAAAVAAALAAGVVGLSALRRPSASSSVLSRDSHVVVFGKKRRGGAQQEAAESEDAPDIDTEAIIKEYSSKMDTTLEMLRDNLATIRAGRATPALLDGVTVTAYESECSIKEVGTITAVDTTTLMVQVFDDSIAPAVEKAILMADLGYSAQTAGPNVKIGIPPLTTEKRAQYNKMSKEFVEKSRVAVRNVRQAALKKVKGLSKKLSEDVVKSMQTEIESLVKKNIGECDKIFKAKEKELMNA